MRVCFAVCRHSVLAVRLAKIARPRRFYVAGVAVIAGVGDVRHALADSCILTLKLLSGRHTPATAATAVTAAAAAALSAAAAWLWQMFMLDAVVMAMMAATVAVAPSAATAAALLTDDLMHIDDAFGRTDLCGRDHNAATAADSAADAPFNCPSHRPERRECGRCFCCLAAATAIGKHAVAFNSDNVHVSGPWLSALFKLDGAGSCRAMSLVAAAAMGRTHLSAVEKKCARVANSTAASSMAREMVAPLGLELEASALAAVSRHCRNSR